MKKLGILLVLFSISAMSFSQLTLGGHYAYNSTWLMNKQVIDEGAEMDVAASFGSYYGLIAGYYFSDNFGLELNFNSNKIVQQYQGSIKYLFTLTDERNLYKASTVIRTTDVPILMKFGKTSYFELGPVIQLVNKATYSRTFEETDPFKPGIYNSNAYSFTNEVNKGVRADFNGAGFGVALGFGANFNLIDDVLKLNFGIRFNYIATDLKGINGLGLNKDSNYISTIEKENFHTNPLYGGLKIGLVYFFE
jgi:hypothetical protein